jgi:hypothetical protein
MREYVILVKRLRHVETGIQRREDREHTRAPVLHVEKFVDLRWLKPDGLAHRRHRLLDLGCGEHLRAMVADGIAEAQQQRVQSRTPDAALQQRSSNPLTNPFSIGRVG